MDMITSNKKILDVFLKYWQNQYQLEVFMFIGYNFLMTYCSISEWVCLSAVFTLASNIYFIFSLVVLNLMCSYH